MNFVLVLKLALVPLLILAVTLTGRRWGPSVAGWLSAFPVVSAPILFFIALEQGSSFAAHAAAHTLAAVLAILVFGIIYSWVATRASWRVSLVASLAGYFAAVAALIVLEPSLLAAVLAVMAALLAAPRLYPASAAPACVAAPLPSNDIGWRMLAGAVMVLLVTHFSSSLGPQLSGLFAMFPVMASVLAVFSHRHSGATFTINLMRGMVLGYYAFVGFCLVLSLTLPLTSVALSFLMATGCAAVIQVLSRIYLQRAATLRQ